MPEKNNKLVVIADTEIGLDNEGKEQVVESRVRTEVANAVKAIVENSKSVEFQKGENEVIFNFTKVTFVNTITRVTVYIKAEDQDKVDAESVRKSFSNVEWCYGIRVRPGPKENWVNI